MKIQDKTKNEIELYKMYANEDYNFSAIKNQKLYLSKPSCFNDKFDCFIGIDKTEFTKAYLLKHFESISKAENFSKQEINETLKKLAFTIPKFSNNANVKLCCLEDLDDLPLLTPSLEREINYLYNQYTKSISKLKDNFYIACFTKIKPENNMVMWNHYANCYRGFCSKFVLKSTDNLFSKLKEVKYSNKIISVDCSKLLSIPLDKLDKNRYIRSLIKKALYLKNKQWAYEKEIRIILCEDDLTSYNIIKLENGILTDFPFLNELYVYSDVGKNSTHIIIESIAESYKLKYYTITPSKEQNSFKLNENIYNKILEFNKIIQKDF